MGQSAVAGRQGLEAFLWGLQQEAAIGLKTRHAGVALGLQGLHGFNHIGRANAGALGVAKAAGFFECGVRADGRDYGLHAQPQGRECAQHVATHKAALLIADPRAVAISISRHHGVKLVLCAPGGGHCFVSSRDGFGVDWDKLVTAAQGNDLRAQLGQQLRQHVAANGAVLVNPNAQALQRLCGHECCVARHIGCQRGAAA